MSSAEPNSRMSLILHGGALIFIYSLYGFLQEKIMRSSTYGPNDEHFTSSSLLIVANRVLSIAVGLSILYFKVRQDSSRGTFVQRLRPASPLFAYASVACFNFLSTTCQYEALKYVSYTTQSLAKTSKMIPVLVVGALVWKKQHKTKEWIAGGVILLGCATYLFSQPPRHSSHAPPASEEHEGFVNGLAGTFFLMGYLFFDGLVSTTQERVFGKNPSSSDPFGPESPVLDQMIWTNTFAGAIAVVVALLSNATGTLLPNLELLLTSPALLWDVLVFSAASALGLIVLLNTIASFGALTSSLIMTIRQFLSILINAGLFGNFGAVSLEGWCGVGWVASGIWIKINRAYDPPKAPRGMEAVNREEVEVLVEKDGAPSMRAFEQKPTVRTFLFQYLVPVAVPVVLAIIIAPFVIPTGALTSTGILNTGHVYLNSSSSAFDSTIPTTVDTIELGHLAETGETSTTTATTEAELAVENEIAAEEEVEAEEQAEEAAEAEEAEAEESQEEAAALGEAEADDVSKTAVQGGKWDSELHDAVAPTCHDITTKPYSGNTRTGFVSYPRSGNSYMRSLVERATGYQTSSIYCDRGLEKTFVGECDHKTGYFVKTHFPALPRVYRPSRDADYYRQFDQVLHLIRNPLDSIASWWHLSHAPRTAEGYQNHEGKVELPGGKFGSEQRKSLLDLAERWYRHAVYWSQAPILTHTLRYEDLKATPIPQMLSLLSFLLPEEDLPPLSDLACMVEANSEHEAYHSRRLSDFASWDKWEDSLRMEVLQIVKRPFCSNGYLKMLFEARGDIPEMVGFCDDVDFRSYVTLGEVKPDKNGNIWKRDSLSQAVGDVQRLRQ